MDLISKLGYSRFSPYQNSPFLDIKSPNGLIDMSNTDIPLLGIGMQTGRKKLLRPRSGTYSFPGDKVIREIKLPKIEFQYGGSTPQEWEKQIRDVEKEIGDPSKWTMKEYNKLQDILNQYKFWRQNTKEGKAVIDYSNEPNEYTVPLPMHLRKSFTYLEPGSFFLPSTANIPENTFSSERAISIGGENGEPAFLVPSFKYGKPLRDEFNEFKKTGHHIGGPFKTWQEAQEYGKLRHKFIDEGYESLPTPIRRWGKDYSNESFGLPNRFFKKGGWLKKLDDGGSVTTTTTLSIIEQYRKDKEERYAKYGNPNRGDIQNRGVAVPVRQATEYKAETTSKEEQEITKIQKENPGYSRHVATLEYNKRKAPKSTTTISQGKQRTQKEEEDRKRKNYEYALNNGLMYNFNTGDVAEPGKTTVGAGWQKVQAPALVQSFASLTPSGNLGAGRIGAETFANMNPLFTGSILSTNRLYTGAKSLFNQNTENPYFNSNNSTFENILGGVNLVGDVANIAIPLKLGTQNIAANSANKYIRPKLTGTRQGTVQLFNNKTGMYETRTVDVPNEIIPGRSFEDVQHKIKNLTKDLNIGSIEHFFNKRGFRKYGIPLERDKGLIINPEGRIWDSNTRYWLNRMYGKTPDPLELIEPNIYQYARSFGEVVSESPTQTMPVGRLIFNNPIESQPLQSGIFNTRDLGQMIRNPKQYFTKSGGPQPWELNMDEIARLNRGEIDPFGETGRFVNFGAEPPRVIDWGKVGKTAFEVGLGTGAVGSGLLLGNKLKKDNKISIQGFNYQNGGFISIPRKEPVRPDALEPNGYPALLSEEYLKSFVPEYKRLTGIPNKSNDMYDRMYIDLGYGKGMDTNVAAYITSFLEQNYDAFGNLKKYTPTTPQRESTEEERIESARREKEAAERNKRVAPPGSGTEYKKGGLIRRKDGSYSRRGLWDNIRANAGSGKQPTKEMLEQERKIKAKR
jgi:hypothetical protein